MLSTLLLILKIIGIILLVVLGLVLLLLFVPILYSGNVSYHEEQLYVKAGAHWLFFPVRFLFVRENDENKITLRIFGINVIRKKKEEPEEEKKPYEPPKAEVDYERFDEAAFLEDEYLVDLVEGDSDYSEDELLDPKIRSIEYPDVDIPDIKDIDTGIKDRWWTKLKKRFKKEKPEEEEEKAPFKERVKKTFGTVKTKLIDKISNSSKGAKKAIEKIQVAFAKTKEFINFVKAKSTRRAIKKAKVILVKVLKHIFPRKMSGRLEYGLKEPHLTGQSLGGVAIAMDMFNIDPEKFEVIPNFDEEVLDAKLEFKGRIFLCVLGVYFLRFYFDRDIKKTIKFFSK